jgi:ketosteroid isomerase-like protein
MTARSMSENDDAQRNIDALRPVYGAWARGEDWRKMLDVYSSAMIWSWSDEWPDIHGTYTDPLEASQVMGEWLSQWEDWRVEAEDFVPVGAKIVVLARYHGIGRESGAEIETRGAHVWTMRDGSAVGIMVFRDRDRALRWAKSGDE